MKNDTAVGTASEAALKGYKTARFMHYLSGFPLVIRDDGLRHVIIMVFTVSWSLRIVFDPVFLDLSRWS